MSQSHFRHAALLALGLGLACAAPAMAAGPAPASAPACPATATEISGLLDCLCPAGAANAPIWGTGVYTADSHICTAARHSGIVGQGGGAVRVYMGGARPSFPGSAAFGVTSESWGEYGSSFTLTAGSGQVTLTPCTGFPSGADRHQCNCGPIGPLGTVWGSGPYTSDSELCTAARHAGVIGEAGGNVTALAVPGLEAYSASTANGITTQGYGPYSGSITFNRN